MKHLDEMTLLLYIERQLDRARGLESVRAHAGMRRVRYAAGGRWSANRGC